MRELGWATKYRIESSPEQDLRTNTVGSAKKNLLLHHKISDCPRKGKQWLMLQSIIFLQSVPSCFRDYPKLSNFQQVKVPAESLEQLPVSNLQVGHLQRVLRLGVFLIDVQWHCVHALQDAFARVAFGWRSPLPCIVWPTSIHHFQMKHEVLNSNFAQRESEIWSQDWRPANTSALQRNGQLLLPNLGRGPASLASPASVMSLTSWKHQVL